MILQINFNLNVPVSEYQKMADSVGHAFRDVPGLRWKIWLLNPAAQEAGGIYLFDSQASLNSHLNGPLVAQLRGLPSIRNISMKQFEVMPEVTALTRGPIEAALTSGV
ncbi:MAG TPA: YdhR family protein [Bryobacteraceae bacterium]|nr:YdhR family protein [Bryobacteraceae bacterium]